MTLARGPLIGYSMLALPLTMAALPIYVHVPKFYAATLGVPLALVGLILLAARLLDAIQDPVLGYLSDRFASGSGGRSWLIVLGVPVLALGFLALFHPPELAQTALAWWMAVSLVIVYAGFSAASISYLAIGAELTSDYRERTRVAAMRGVFGIIGVLIAAALPELLAQRAGVERGAAQFSLIFVPVLLVCAFVTLRYTPRVRKPEAAKSYSWRAMFKPLAHREFRWLIAVSVPSGIAGAIPATLILFFVDDVLQAAALSGLYLAAYFLSAAIAMPAWVSLSAKIGKKNAWLLGMIMSVAAFTWAFGLVSGNVASFAVICVLSGVAYGAELALPPSILADLVDTGHSDGDQKANGAYFGLWQMIEKLNLAAAAGISLPLLSFLGYVPGAIARDQFALSATYALLPCAIKLLAALVLWSSPVDRPAARERMLISEGGLS